MILTLLLLLAAADPATAAQPELDAKVCQMMVAHEPAPGVQYEPGTDVHGKPVVEADINPSPVTVPSEVSFDITVDLAKYIGLTAPEGIEGTAKIGTLVIGGDGRMTFDGKPLEGDAEAALRALCTDKPKLQKTRINDYTE